MIDPRKTPAGRVLALLDLTSLNEADNLQSTVDLCRRALTPYGEVAAVCVWPKLAHVARRTLNTLGGRSVKVASVCNFPTGDAPLADVVEEVRKTLAEGADEIDLVYPWRKLKAGGEPGAVELIRACKTLCGPYHRLKVILETGELADPELIRRACRDAIAGGADFLKTSTGKASVNATPEAVQVMLECIGEAGSKVGLKVSGGLRTLADAQRYRALVEERFGAAWITPEHLRFGASALLDDLLRELGGEARPVSTRDY
ncbi:deoxyribose-phosphate aldolase [Pseudomonas sp. ZM23]|uniref:Deoxyribose-phosphate aldolase n=1 Tax=Pseudomonas triclosanedens TaxID=2961893 RepID=A0ABY7A2R4_9PSED|nr:deoxyribose-phosphate aldolase [Pseudomonas triclosanedens]MCP8464059.1 deoxyribose-phosphate aldolase [Pseudomonas triclosanedens]MCP8469143.1 deoxyribose-phosphate aldolase [Pseudomonas triclosanedens]MCP8475865.1 deoxyribose-phosphate aldolase [Pseudomonas triclosanedens]WAI50433.1 deoxyribose-phosphate aldolase [Pseudomonas triclosanedens]